MQLNDFLRRDETSVDVSLNESVDPLQPLKATLMLAPEAKADAASAASKAKAVLKKPDRVLWFMRLYNIALLRRLTDNERDPERKAALATAFHHASTTYALRLGAHLSDADLADVSPPGFPILKKLGHYLSYPIPEMQTLSFGWWSPEGVEHKLRAFEERWAANQTDRIEPGEGDTVLIEFPSGVSWIMLDRAYCPHEGAAMGHCGNEPRRNTGDRILSLRRTERIGDKSYHKPYLTFILHDDGMLGEMKGRFNRSPKHAFEEGASPSDFHVEIAALLRMPMIKGIIGGGYMPEENFSLSDLPEEMRRTLIEARPELGGLDLIHRHFGMEDARFWPMLRARLDALGMEEPDFLPGVPEGNFIVERWRNFRDFVGDVEYGSDLHGLVKLYNDMDADDPHLAEVESRIESYIATGWPWECWYSRLVIPTHPTGGHDLDGEVTMVVLAEHFVDLLSSGEGTEDAHLLEHVKTHGWTGYDPDALEIGRQTKGLYDENGSDPFLAELHLTA